jgi:DNA-binding PadR family transcriptional regulator
MRLFEALLADPAAWRYGYDLSRQTKLASGTLYPILMRLSERDLLETRWEPSDNPGRPPRHTYRLTADGAALARERLGTHAESTAAAQGTKPAVQTRSVFTLGTAS